MRRGALSIVLLAGCLLLAGCQAAPRTAAPATHFPISETLQPADSTTPDNPAPTLTLKPAQNGTAQTRYRIEATLDGSLRSLRVREEIHLTNPTGLPLAALPLVVEANCYEGAFELAGVSGSDGIVASVAALDLNALTLSLQPALPADATLILTLEYSLRLPAILPEQPRVFGYTQRQLNLTDWYPFFPAYSAASGWTLHPPAAVGEHTVYPAADFDVDLHLPQLDPPLVVAASSPAESIADGYRYHLVAARNFVWSASQQYRVNVQQAGPLTVTSYAYPATELAGRAALDTTVQALNYFSNQFGLPPRGSLSIVQADFPDGMEYDGLFFLSERFYYGYDGSPRSYLALISVHETAHQWWYARIGNDQALDPWLDEALCTYSELLFYQVLNPELADWWWGFRVEPYEPQGSLDTTVYDFNQFLPYRNRVYLRGAQFLDSLRQALGDEAFFSALQAYARRFDGRIATRQDFFDVFQDKAQTDLAPLIAQFFSR